jgi:phage-related tail fiber protein
VFAGSTAVVKASRFANNTTQGGASAVGGGIFNGGTLTLESTRIEGNRARGGGGIFNSRNARLTLNQGAAITLNTATDPTPSGGGIYNIGTIVDNDPASNVSGNIPDNCISEAPGTGCPA